MAWETEMPLLLRVLVNDLASPQTYTDSRLKQVVVVAAQLIQVEMRFSQSFSPNVVDETLSPDPCDRDAGTRDDSFVNLCCLKAACIIERGETRRSAAQGIYIRDAGSAIDTRSQVLARLKILDKNWCEVYEHEKLQYLAGQVRVAGAAILSPFRLWATESAGVTVPSFGYEGRR